MTSIRTYAAVAALVAIAVMATGNAGAEDKAGALGEMALGDPDAPVTVIEYASVTCSHCADWHETVFPTIKETYVDAGKVRFILREMPVVPDHPALVARSYAGSMLARCAADAGGKDAYFDVMGTLFKEQESWAFGQDAKGALLKIAGDAGMSEADFDACLGRTDLKAHIDANIEIGINEFEIQGTPGFVIDGAYQRVFSLEDVSKALDEALEASQ
jgi:protein-disulfide isomerase